MSNLREKLSENWAILTRHRRAAPYALTFVEALREFPFWLLIKLNFDQKEKLHSRKRIYANFSLLLTLFNSFVNNIDCLSRKKCSITIAVYDLTNDALLKRQLLKVLLHRKTIPNWNVKLKRFRETTMKEKDDVMQKKTCSAAVHSQTQAPVILLNLLINKQSKNHFECAARARGLFEALKHKSSSQVVSSLEMKETFRNKLFWTEFHWMTAFERSSCFVCIRL